jgi:hypothetical protein
MNGTTPFRLVQLLFPCHGMLGGHAVDIEPVSGLIAKIREYFNSRTKIFGLLLVWKFEFVTQCRTRVGGPLGGNSLGI